MITELLAAARAVPKILDALERLGDVATAQLAQHRKEVKDGKVEDIISGARARRIERLSLDEAERLRGDRSTSPTRDGGSDSD